MQKSAVEGLAQMRQPLESSTMTIGTPGLKYYLIKWIVGTEFDQNGAQNFKTLPAMIYDNNQIFG
jgi:hypothetical protein